MKFVLLLGFLLYSILTTHSMPHSICSQMVGRATERCMHNFKTNNLFESMKQVGRNEISIEEFEYRVESICPHWLNTDICNIAIENVINKRCLIEPGINTTINAFKFVVGSSAYMCEHNGQRFLHYVDNDGVYCSENTPEEQQCSSELRAQLAPHNPNELFTDNNMCEYIRGEIECSQYLEVCENNMLADISIGALEHVKTILRCDY